MKLELGSGKRPSEGYLTSDINAFDGIDFITSPEHIGLPSNSLEEILALGVFEHLTFAQVDLSLTNCFRMLRSDGFLLFDVPDLPIWAEYYVRSQRGEEVPVDAAHILGTLFGHQRWPGDTHCSGWCKESITKALNRAGFHNLEFGVHVMTDRGHKRNRFSRPEDAHIYVCARKT